MQYYYAKHARLHNFSIMCFPELALCLPEYTCVVVANQGQSWESCSLKHSDRSWHNSCWYPTTHQNYDRVYCQDKSPTMR